MEGFLGTGIPTTCKVFGPDLSVHWWSEESQVDDPCFCGALQYRPHDEEAASTDQEGQDDG
jgi:hypothetical protein